MGVKKGHEAYLAAMRANDADAFARVVAPDAVFSPPNILPLIGREAVRAWFRSGAERMRTVGITVEDRNVIVAGAHAVEEGTFVWTVVPAAGGAPVVERGRFNATWQRQSDGEWKVLRHIWNSSLPLPAGDSAHNRAGDEGGVRELFARMEAAGNARDQARVAAAYTPDGDIWIAASGPDKPEKRVVGPDNIRQHLETGHGTPAEKLRLTVDNIRFLTPDVALADGTSTSTHEAGGFRATASLIVVRQGDSWKLAAVRVMKLESLDPAPNVRAASR